MINILILSLWLVTPLLIFRNSKIQPYFLFGSFSLSIFDNPFNVNIYYFFFFGVSYFFIKVFYKIINININIFLFYFILYNTIITIIFYSIYFYDTDASFSIICYTYFVAQFKIIGLFGIYYYLTDYRISISNFNFYFIPPLLISTIVGYLIYFGFDSPYYYFKNFGYTTNESSTLSIIRLSGLTQEPRYLSYLIVFSLFTISFSYYSRIKSFFIKIFLCISLFLTKSLSGFMLLLLAILYSILTKYKIFKALLLYSFSFSLILFSLFSFNNNFNTLINQRIFDRNLLDFNYLPNFFSYFEHHDLVALKFLEDNWFAFLFGTGYGQIKNYEAVFGEFVDPTMTLFNYNTSVHCCDPQSLLVNFISSFGIINLLIISFFYFRNIRINNVFLAFILFNLLNLSPGPLPLFIMIFALCINFKNTKFTSSSNF
uniref:hypothetical protein n=1 Tax=Polynucleobacter sp. TaxID=2029855 RepID=UPI0040473E5A